MTKQEAALTPGDLMCGDANGYARVDRAIRLHLYASSVGGLARSPVACFAEFRVILRKTTLRFSLARNKHTGGLLRQVSNEVIRMEGRGRPEGNETERLTALLLGPSKAAVSFMRDPAVRCGRRRRCASRGKPGALAEISASTKRARTSLPGPVAPFATRQWRNCRNRSRGGRAARLLDPDVLDHWADLAAEENWVASATPIAGSWLTAWNDWHPAY